MMKSNSMHTTPPTMLMSSTISSLSLSSSSSTSLPCLNTHHHFIQNPPRRSTLCTTPPTTHLRLRVSSSDNLTAVVVSSSQAAAASDVVRSFYERINGRDLPSVEELIADKCVYEDLIFATPFVGRQAIMEFFKKFTDSISAELQFVIDDISTEDSSAVGVTWHLEWKGRTFPFSKGCSFYRLEVVNGRRQIIYGRDSVEPAIKPGETALAAIGAVTWLLQQFPQLADRL